MRRARPPSFRPLVTYHAARPRCCTQDGATGGPLAMKDGEWRGDGRRAGLKRKRGEGPPGEESRQALGTWRAGKRGEIREPVMAAAAGAEDTERRERVDWSAGRRGALGRAASDAAGVGARAQRAVASKRQPAVVGPTCAAFASSKSWPLCQASLAHVLLILIINDQHTRHRRWSRLGGARGIGPAKESPRIGKPKLVRCWPWWPRHPSRRRARSASSRSGVFATCSAVAEATTTSRRARQAAASALLLLPRCSTRPTCHSCACS